MATVTSIHEHKGNRVAVLLNAHARKVTPKVQAELERFVPREDLYFSRNFDDARAISREVLSKGYRTLLVGGGDGSFVGFVNLLVQESQDRKGSGGSIAHGSAALHLAPQASPLPDFGILRLGTGNALATLTGSSEGMVGMVEDVLRARTGDVLNSRRIQLVRSESKLAPFAGLGLDAGVLNDYRNFHRLMSKTPMSRLGSGLTGYALAVLTRSVPKQLLSSRDCPEVVITNTGGPARQVAPDGRLIGKPIETGEIIYKGPCRIAAVGTVPCYGFGFTLFPHIPKTPGQMQLRLSAMPVMEALKSIPAIWKGRTPPTGLLDFHVDRVHMSFDRPMPFQIGGDAEGERREVEMGLDSRQVNLLDFGSRD